MRLASFVFCACLLAPMSAFAAPLKVGFIYSGPVGDRGWSYQHNEGRLAVERAFGDRVETVYLESVGEGDEAVHAIEGLVRSGAGLIFTTSFGFMDPTLEVAARHPDVKFEHATGYKRAENVSTYSARFYEGRYILGHIAAKISHTGVAGYIASFPIPEVVHGINAFMLGAQSVDADFQLRIFWISSWFDPRKEAEAAKLLIGQGADVLAQHTDSTAPLQIAAQQGVLGFGQASDMRVYALHTQLTSIIDNWNAYYVARTQAVLDGTWTSRDTWDGIAEGMVSMAPYANMPEEVADSARQVERLITEGRLHPFSGPFYRQDGTLAVQAGRFLDDEALLGMDWYVQGIEEALPR